MNLLTRNVAVLTAAIQALAVTTAIGQDLEAWNQDRARIFSRVCMASAPSFSDFELLAVQEGFENVSGEWLFQPEVVVSLMEHGEICSCYMTVGAPDQTAMVGTMFDQLMDDFGDDFRGSLQGMVNVVPFEREGAEVISHLEPFSSSGQSWIAAQILVSGDCPKPEEGL